MKKQIKVIIAIPVGLIGMIILINGLFNKKDIQIDTTGQETTIEAQISNETTTTSTTTTKKVKTTKKVVKTTKKKVVKKKTKYKNFNIKYNRNEIVNYLYQEVVRRWGEEQWKATYNIVSHESGFNPNDVNKKSGACGLFQANPCNKTIENGYKDYKTNWKTQVRWGLDYITVHKRYGTPKKAWEYWKKHHSY